ncbi:15529_t:CDS:2, partial [Cetraspora pellucida]
MRSFSGGVFSFLPLDSLSFESLQTKVLRSSPLSNMYPLNLVQILLTRAHCLLKSSVDSSNVSVTLKKHFRMVDMTVAVFEGCITSHHALASSIIYLLISEGATILLPIPYSFIWFRFQGLTIDFALFIQFMRIYLKTKKIARNAYSSLPQHTPDENEPEERNQPNHKCHFYAILLTF